MWYATVDWGMGVKDSLCKDEDFWQLLVKLGSIPPEAVQRRLREAKEEAAIQVFFIPTEDVYVEPEYFKY